MKFHLREKQRSARQGKCYQCGQSYKRGEWVLVSRARRIQVVQHEVCPSPVVAKLDYKSKAAGEHE